MSRAITVLVVSCPCAFVLSSPAAMIAALAVASRFGILIKNTQFLEKLAEVDTLVLDKTGTITLGELEVVEVRPSDGVNAEGLLKVAATAAAGSRHPVSRAIFREAEKRGHTLQRATDVNEVPGKGLLAHSGGDTVALGRKQWLLDEGFKVPEGSSISHTGPVVWVATKEQNLGALLLADRPRPEVKETLSRLKRMGFSRITMLTGDRKTVAEALAGDLRLDAVSSELLPEQKLDAVREEKARDRTVMVVGDGINDALALAAGDVGVAMGAMGSEVAIQSSDIALMHNNLGRLATAVGLSRETRKTINMNIFAGAGFSILMLGLAALGVIAPLAGALLHNVGALFVVFNSARLLKYGS
jgi:Cd2+/Zn2+-exporting ATPase/Cu+-exporting ATPase